MIQSINKGRGFRGATNYVTGKDNAERLPCGTMAGQIPRELSAEAGVFRKLRPKLKKACFHTSISLGEKERLSSEQWADITTRYMKEMGFENAPWYAVRHSGFKKDKDGNDTTVPLNDHIHLVALRITAEGKTISDSKDFARGAKFLQGIEKEYGLKKSAHTPAQAWELPERGITPGEMRHYKKTNDPWDKETLKSVVQEALKDNPTPEVFFDRLRWEGIAPRPAVTKAGKVNGISFETENITVKGSSLGKSFSWAGLQKMGLDYSHDRDAQFFKELKYGSDRGHESQGQSQSQARGRNDGSDPTTNRRPGQSPGDHRPGDQRPGATRDRDPERIERDRDQIQPAGRPGQVRGRDPESRDSGNENKPNAEKLRAKGKGEHGQSSENRRDNGTDIWADMQRSGSGRHDLSSRDKGAAMIKKTTDSANEIAGFKRDISLLDYAAARGFALDKRKSSRRTAVMRRENEKLAISRNDNGHWVFADLKGGMKGGTIIDFCQKETGYNLGQVRKELRQFSPSGVCVDSYIPVKQVSKEAQAKILESEKAKAFPLKNPEYLFVRGVSKSILEESRFKGRVFQDHRGNVCFPHGNDQGFSGYEKKNQGFTGFSEGGEKGLWFSRPQGDEKELVFVESAIDALSHAQMHPGNKAAYLSLGGQFSLEQEKLVKKIMENSKKKIVLAFDNDDQGRKYVKDFQRLAKELPVTTDSPQAKDWNAELVLFLEQQKKEKKRQQNTSGSLQSNFQTRTQERGHGGIGSAAENLRKRREKKQKRTPRMR